MTALSSDPIRDPSRDTPGDPSRQPSREPIPDSVRDAQESLLERLQDSRLFPHPAAEFTRISTHSSQVLLTGHFAYKIKRPVLFPFMDYSTLEKRRAACLQEMRINQRFAPGLYVEAVAICEHGAELSLKSAGDEPVEGAIEYAVKMHQFRQEQLLARIADAGKLTDADVDAMAGRMAAVHERAEIALPQTGYGDLPVVERWVMENFEQLEKLIGSEQQQLSILEELRQYTVASLRELGSFIRQRLQEGHVRACHGDLHLNNMIRQSGDVLFFDAIEFNEELRWIDTQSELAFTLMDLIERGQSRAANRLMNGYLSLRDDYAGLPVLRLYLLYRALVRTKVEALRGGEAEKVKALLERHLGLARGFGHPPKPFVLLLHGFSGSGKSTLARWAAAQWQGVHLRSDVERKRLAGLEAGESSHSRPGQGIYSPSDSAATYERLADLSRTVVGAGWPVVVDAAFLSAAQRAAFRQWAKDAGHPVLLLSMQVPEAILRERLLKRERVNAALPPETRDPSEAGISVLELQLQSADSISEEEGQMLFLPPDWQENAGTWAATVEEKLGL